MNLNIKYVFATLFARGTSFCTSLKEFLLYSCLLVLSFSLATSSEEEVKRSKLSKFV